MNEPQLTRMSAAQRHGKRIAQGTSASAKAQRRKGESASGKLCAGRQLIRARLLARRPRGELVGTWPGSSPGFQSDSSVAMSRT